MTKTHLTIATRESPLALWQANWVKERLESLHPKLQIKLLGMTTKADRMLDVPLYTVGGKGLFVKELEEALLDGRADIAVHSMKDIPMILPDGLCLPVMCEREEPRDAFVSNQFASLSELPLNAIVGTSSLRRQSQLSAYRPDLQLVSLRGNVNTRLQKLDNGEFNAIILAAAGLQRLGLASRIRNFLTIEECLPAVGQGVLGIECRKNDNEVQALIAPLNHAATHLCVATERAMCTRLGGGCSVPIASYAQINGKSLELRGLVARVDGTVVLKVEKSGPLTDPKRLGESVAEELLAQGAGEILQEMSR